MNPLPHIQPYFRVCDDQMPSWCLIHTKITRLRNSAIETKSMIREELK